ncbi:MAG: aspartyl/asparaginyl beta-hydroxylase domain-containing protein [Tatlockia sp.]|nr:aspartyl/asparaginyl beta-hydroxylase domain-containing protein [Tatlockia sp.]
MFYETTGFKFIDCMESNWLLVKEELTRLQQANFIPWPEKFLYNQGWDVYGLYAFEKRLEDNCRLCPETTKLVESIPGMTTAGFSSLAPGTHIASHVGYSEAVLRCHLGLIIPDGCGIRVGTQTKTWLEGKCLVFDDTVEHEAWNRGKLPRIVLLIDFKKPNIPPNFPQLGDLPNVAKVL